LDKEAPLPYKRRGKDTTTTVKFSFDQKVTTEETTKVGDVETTKKITTIKTKKVDLLTYADSSDEDAESFFHAFERYQVELKDTWNEAKKAKTNDAKVLFEGIDKMLKESANTEWHDVLNQVDTSSGLVKYPDKDWETFKKSMSEYIMTKILTEDAYDKQKNYLQERIKPLGFTAKQWWLRIQTLNRWLIYFFKELDDLKDEVSGADWKDWWTKGSIPTAEIRRIITTKAPQSWQKALKLHTVDQRKLPIETIIVYYTKLEAFEMQGREPTTRGPRGRFQPRGGRRIGRVNSNYNNRQTSEGSYTRNFNNNNMGRSSMGAMGRSPYTTGFQRGTQGFNRFGGRGPPATGGRGPSGPKKSEQYAQFEQTDDDNGYQNNEEDLQTEEQAYQAWNDQWEEEEEDGVAEEGEPDSQEQEYQEEDYYFYDEFDEFGWHGNRCL